MAHHRAQPYSYHRPERYQHETRSSYRYKYEKPECEFPRFPSPRWSRSIWFVIILFAGLFSLTALAAIVVNIFLTIKFIDTDNTGFEPQNSDFQLFKNSRFEECASRAPDAANCTAIMDIINHSTYEADQKYLSSGYIPISTHWRGHDGTYFDWCTTASCFNGYKVVPSTYRSSIIGLTNFGIWTNVNMVALASLFVFLKRIWNILKSKDEECKGGLREIGLIHGAFALYTTSSNMIWWWVDYIQFAMKPVPNTIVSVFAWTTTWLLASNIHYHPYSCVVGRSTGLKRVLSWLLAFLAVAQWCATVHILNVGWKDAFQKEGIYQGYDCAEDVIAEAAGTGQCSAEKLCSNTALLSNMSFYWDFSENMIVTVSVAFFVLLTMVAAQPFIFASWRSLRGLGSWSEQFKRGDIGPIAGPALAGIFAAFYVGAAASVAIYLLNHVDREGPLLAYPDCNVVHVGLSTWRYYLDVNPDSRALRIVKSWLNA